jgi:predicted acyltransferase
VNQRYYSLDVFRGATVALMILVNNPGSWAHIYSPLEHAPWHGLTPTDLVFPFFLFAVGNAMAFVMPRLEAAGPAVFWRKVIKRTVLIFAIGLFLNWWPFARWQGDQLLANGWTWINAKGTLTGVRIFGVLQRIALCLRDRVLPEGQGRFPYRTDTAAALLAFLRDGKSNRPLQPAGLVRHLH